MLSGKIFSGVTNRIHHANHLLPALCGKLRFRTLKSLYYEVQITECMIRLCDTGSLVNKHVLLQLDNLNKLRGKFTCALASPTGSAIGRKNNPIVIVENCLHALGFAIDTDTGRGHLTSTRPHDKLILNCLPRLTLCLCTHLI